MTPSAQPLASTWTAGRPLRELMDLTGRRALITGGAGHIGAAMAHGLLELGADVALVDRDPAACAERAAALAVDGRRAVGIPCDLLDEAATRAAVRGTLEQLGGLDILLHCAAYVGTTTVPGWSVPFDQQTVRAWDEALRVNLTAAFVLAQEARSALEASGRGSIILIGSTYGLVGPVNQMYEGTPMAQAAGYAASKGGVLQLMRYLATSMAPRVRVNAISPGGVWRNQPEAFHQRYVARTPMARMAREEDLKGAAAYLASDLSAYVTGHNLVVDGGWTAW